VWLPGRGCSARFLLARNFEAFQGARANIRYRPEAILRLTLVQLLNGSGLAVGRTWLAILENYQQADGTVMSPEALRPYMGTDRITAKKF